MSRRPHHGGKPPTSTTTDCDMGGISFTGMKEAATPLPIRKRGDVPPSVIGGHRAVLLETFHPEVAKSLDERIKGQRSARYGSMAGVMSACSVCFVCGDVCVAYIRAVR